MGSEKIFPDSLEASFLPDSLVTDSLNSTIQNIKVSVQLPPKSTLENFYFIATLIIAAVNVGLIIYVFVKNNKKEEAKVEKKRKISLLKTLVLNYNLDKLYHFFETVCEKTNLLRDVHLTDEDKVKINEDLVDQTTIFRQNFIDLFIAIDKTLYDEILTKADALVDGLTDQIFNEGINLSHPPKFEEVISKEIRKTKADIIKILFSYSG